MASLLLLFLAGVAMTTALPSEIYMMRIPSEEFKDYAPVNLTMYYESLCPGCEDFISGPLNQTWQAIGSSGILDVTLIPFGNAKMSKEGKKYKFTCQHGPTECEGNILEACLIHYEPKFADHFPAIWCIETYFIWHEEWKAILKNDFEEISFYQSKKKIEPPRTQCSDVVKTDIKTIEECVEGDLGNELEHEMGERTGPHSYVPWPLINGVLYDLQANNLTATVCAAYKVAMLFISYLKTGNEMTENEETSLCPTPDLPCKRSRLSTSTKSI